MVSDLSAFISKAQTGQRIPTALNRRLMDNGHDTGALYAFHSKMKPHNQHNEKCQ